MDNTNERFLISIEEVTDNILIDVTTGSSGTNNYNDLLNKPDLTVYATDSDLLTKADETYVDTAKAEAITSSNAYTDAEISAIPTVDISGKADIIYVDSTLTSKVDKVFGKSLTENNFTDAQVTKLSTAESVTGAQTKADAAEANANTYTDTEIGKIVIPSIDGLASTTYVDQAEADAKAYSDANKTSIVGLASETYVDQAEVDAKAYADANRPDISGKADTTYVDSQDSAQNIVINTKASTTYVDNGLAGKVDKDGTKVLSDTNYTQAEKDKLSGIEGSKFKGTYTTLGALETAEPNPGVGSYAHVDGVGTPVKLYIWDINDSAWTVSSEGGTEETAASVKTKYESNADTNVYDDTSKAKVDGLPINVESVEGAQSKADGAETASNSYTDTALTSKEDSFTKNTAFNKNFGTIVGTIPQGNDSRILNGQTAFTWGNHSTQGYLTSYTETDPIFNASPSAGILAGDIINWDTAFTWGDHSIVGYLTELPVHNHDDVYYTETEVNTLLDGKVDDAQVLTNVPAGALFTDTDTVYDDTAIQAEVDLNTAKVSNVDHPLVESAVPVGAVFTDTVYDDTTIQAEVDLNTAKVSNVDHPLVETAVPVGAVFTDTDTVYDDTAIQADVDSKLAKETNIQGFWRGTQAAYDGLTPDDNTIYFIEA